MIAAQPQNPAPMVIWHGEREVLRIEVDHTILHGQRVDDAGEAHRALVWALTGIAQPWHPIATAPKDGSSILACVPGGQVRVVQWDIRGSSWEECEWHTVFPTHWMPLPPPPK